MKILPTILIIASKASAIGVCTIAIAIMIASVNMQYNIQIRFLYILYIYQSIIFRQ